MNLVSKFVHRTTRNGKNLVNRDRPSCDVREVRFRSLRTFFDRYLILKDGKTRLLQLRQSSYRKQYISKTYRAIYFYFIGLISKRRRLFLRVYIVMAVLLWARLGSFIRSDRSSKFTFIFDFFLNLIFE